jgi:hypothetical protein
MIEFALVLPLLMMLALLMIFFGKGMLSKQNVLMADRQLAWRLAKELTPDQADDSGFLRKTYFANQPIGFAANSPAGGWNGSRQSEESLVRAVPVGESLSYATDVVTNYYPGNVDYQIDITLPPDVTPLARFAPDISDAYYRQGIPWQYPNVKIWDPLWNRFVGAFDSMLSNQGLGNDLGLVSAVRQLYQRPWKAPGDP